MGHKGHISENSLHSSFTPEESGVAIYTPLLIHSHSTFSKLHSTLVSLSLHFHSTLFLPELTPLF